MDFLLGRQGWCDIQVTLFMPFNCAKHELFAFPLLRLVILELSSEKMVVGPLENAPYTMKWLSQTMLEIVQPLMQTQIWNCLLSCMISSNQSTGHPTPCMLLQQYKTVRVCTQKQ